MPRGTLASSVRSASLGSIVSSLVCGTPLYTTTIRDLETAISELNDRLEALRASGHGHSTGGYAAASYPQNERVARQIQNRLAALTGILHREKKEESERLSAGGGRLGVLSACLGKSEISFILRELDNIRNQLDRLRPDVEEQARGIGTMAEGIGGMHGPRIEELTEAERQARQKLRAAIIRRGDENRNGGGGGGGCGRNGRNCTISRKSRRRRNARQQRSRKNRRR